MQKRYSALIILALLIGGLFFYWFLQSEKSSFFKDIGKLYSRFTPKMMNVIRYRLIAVDCNPSNYYNDNGTSSALCFICGNKKDACFNYKSVPPDESGINFDYLIDRGSYLKGNYNNIDELTFYSFGVSEILDCQPNFECFDGIKATIEKDSKGATSVFFDFPVQVTVGMMNDTIERVAGALGFDPKLCVLEEFSGWFKYTSCENLSISWIEEKKIKIEIE